MFLAIGLFVASMAGCLIYLGQPPVGVKPMTAADVYAARLKMAGSPPSAESAPRALPWKQTVRLAVGGLGYATDGENRDLGDLITAQLSSAKGLELIERQELNAALNEGALNLSGLVRAKDAVHAGKLLRADWFLLGTKAEINGASCLVVRLVDARSGITRDGAVFVQTEMPTLAAEVADFVRQQRQIAAEAKPRVYLAIGSFQDLSANNRQADFPQQLRGYLIGAFQHSRLTLLEREYADLLLQEMELDLAGMTEEGGTNTVEPMQSAFWLVDGAYQSYETAQREMEMELQVRRIFGTMARVSIKAPTAEGLCGRVKDAIDRVMNGNTLSIIPTRMSEIRAQLNAGQHLMVPEEKTLSFLTLGVLEYPEGLLLPTWNMDPYRAARTKRNLQEAMRAFRTVLLLDPDNHEAKIDLSACLRVFDHPDEACHYYRQIIEDPVQDRWTAIAGAALAASFQQNPGAAVDFFESAAKDTTNATAAAFYRQHAEAAAALAPTRGSENERLADERLFREMQSFRDSLKEVNPPNPYEFEFGTGEYVRSFGDRVQGAERLAALVPEVKKRYPEMEPYFVAAAVGYQEDTNAPIVSGCQKTLGELKDHPEQIFAPKQFWNFAEHNIFDWAFAHKMYPLAVEVDEAATQNGAGHKTFEELERDKIGVNLALSYVRLQQWAKALPIFESYSNHAVISWVSGNGTLVLTDKEAARCRAKLGLSPVSDPREFQVHDTCLPFPSPWVFTVDDVGLWIAGPDQLLHLDFNLKTNVAVDLPSPSTFPTCVSTGGSQVWIGTQNAGLFEYDKATRDFRHLTQNNGLLMDEIACLHLSGTTLWIGYGAVGDSDGGVGKLDLPTHQLTSFSRSLKAPGRQEQPPAGSVISIVDGAPGELWLLTADFGLHRYRVEDQVWESPQHVLEARAGITTYGLVSAEIVSDPKQVAVGKKWNPGSLLGWGALGVDMFDLESKQWRSLDAVDGLPSGTVTAVALDGNDLWAGGLGYIAVIDVPQGKVRKLARVNTCCFEQMEIGGGFVWTRNDQYLHRILLSDGE